jgi:hypothetical protein
VHDPAATAAHLIGGYGLPGRAGILCSVRPRRLFWFKSQAMGSSQHPVERRHRRGKGSIDVTPNATTWSNATFEEIATWPMTS